MRLVLDTLLDRPRDEVWRAFENPANLRKWQPTLVRVEPVSGVPGRVGAVSRLSFDEDGHPLGLTEKVTGSREPEELAFSYEAAIPPTPPATASSTSAADAPVGSSKPSFTSKAFSALPPPPWSTAPSRGACATASPASRRGWRRGRWRRGLKGWSLGELRR